MKFVTLVTDGACKGNPGPGGWACLLRCNSTEKIIVGGQAESTTNNRMELLAVIKGFESLKEPVEVEVVTDSLYIVQTFKNNWISKWQNNGWMTNSGPVKNQDLWKRLVQVALPHLVRWTWVKGHSGHEDNEKVDALAQAEAFYFAQLGDVDDYR